MTTDNFFRSRGFIVWLGFVAIACLALLATCPGCAVASKEHVQPMASEQFNRLGQQIEAVTAMVRSSVESTSTQTQNEIWPIVVMVLGLAGLGIWLTRLIVRTSYLRQKPIWLKRRECQERP